MMSLEHGTQNDKKSDQDDSPFETQQATTYRSTDTIGCIIGTDIPADVCTGSQQYEKNWFDGSVTPSLKIWFLPTNRLRRYK